MQKVYYVVGTNIKTSLESCGPNFFTVPTDGPEFNTPHLPFFYIDTRSMEGRGEYWDIFTSTHNPRQATKYENYEEAKAWNDKFLDGAGVIYRF